MSDPTRLQYVPWAPPSPAPGCTRVRTVLGCGFFKIVPGGAGPHQPGRCHLDGRSACFCSVRTVSQVVACAPLHQPPHHLAGLHWCKRRASVGTGRRHWALRTGCQPLLCGRSQVWVLSNHCARIRGGPTAEARRRSVTSPSDVDPCPEMAQGPEQQGGNLNPFASPRRVRAAAPQ